MMAKYYIIRDFYFSSLLIKKRKKNSKMFCQCFLSLSLIVVFKKKWAKNEWKWNKKSKL